MHHFLYALFIALTNNVDNIGARFAYSLGGIKISIPINFWITVVTFVISFIAAFSGTKLSGAMGKQFSSIIAMVILIAIGVWMMRSPYLKKRSKGNCSRGNSKNIFCLLSRPERADMDNSKHIDFKEATLLGIALSINNIGGGLSAGMIGLNPLLVGILSAVLSFFALWIGNYVAEFFIRRNVMDKTAIAGGILLIAVGIGQLF